MPSVHDNIILSYEVDLENEFIRMRTRSYHSDLSEDTDIFFSDVLAHSFDTPMQGSIIFDIDDVGLDHFINYNRELLEKGKGQGWPITYKTDEELESKLIEGEYQYFVITSSYGLSGWVLAKKVEMITKQRNEKDEE
ncbi:hypothetical protein P5G61_22830 [Paenibacillus sp. F6_3S_P_1C]|uniref:Uncharacterized protein n=1 Tax=Paenibacillus vandeheii TaxID=3035917 RepID=A0ABT8JIZ3_9BACL|nr:hypothetical protein [Paenibacillus vandeheii]MDN4604094.1 hypothetical protein [Paenibacillus vandeheii]